MLEQTALLPDFSVLACPWTRRFYRCYPITPADCLDGGVCTPGQPVNLSKKAGPAFVIVSRLCVSSGAALASQRPSLLVLAKTTKQATL